MVEPLLAWRLVGTREKTFCRPALHGQQGQKPKFTNYSSEVLVSASPLTAQPALTCLKHIHLATTTVLLFYVFIGCYMASPFIPNDLHWKLSICKNKHFAAFLHKLGDCISRFYYSSTSLQKKKCHLPIQKNISFFVYQTPGTVLSFEDLKGYMISILSGIWCHLGVG